MRETIFITGAGRRVGLAVARQLLADGYGVIAHYRSASEGVDRLVEAGARVIQADLEDVDALRAMLAQIQHEYSQLRAVIHNASLFEPTAEDPDQALGQLQRFFAVHMQAPYLINQGLSPLLEQAQGAWADIVHMVDIYAERPRADLDLYCATKAGLSNLTLSWAQRYAPKIKVNAIAPGVISFPEGYSPAQREALLATVPLQREGGWQAIYATLQGIFANPYMTGTVLSVDGGRRISL